MVVLQIHDSIDSTLKGEKKIKIVKLLGAGAYGRVYLTNLKNIVIKIFLKQTDITSVNMEYRIFKKLIEYIESYSGESMRDSDSKYPKNLVKALNRGELKTGFEYGGHEHDMGEYFIMVPLYQKFYQVQNRRQNLRDPKFILDFITVLLKVCIFLEKKLKIVNMDIKTSNIMYDGKELVLIDLGLIQKIDHGKEIFVPDKKYMAWPYDSCFVVTIPVYSIAICVIEFFFGKLKVWKIQSMDDVNKYLNNISDSSKNIAEILQKMISLKYDPSTVLKYIEVKYKSDLEIREKDLKIPNKDVEPIQPKRKRKKKKINKWYSNLLNSVHN